MEKKVVLIIQNRQLRKMAGENQWLSYTFSHQKHQYQQNVYSLELLLNVFMNPWFGLCNENIAFFNTSNRFEALLDMELVYVPYKKQKFSNY